MMHSYQAFILCLGTRLNTLQESSHYLPSNSSALPLGGCSQGHLTSDAAQVLEDFVTGLNHTASLRQPANDLSLLLIGKARLHSLGSEQVCAQEHLEGWEHVEFWTPLPHTRQRF